MTISIDGAGNVSVDKSIDSGRLTAAANGTLLIFQTEKVFDDSEISKIITKMKELYSALTSLDLMLTAWHRVDAEVILDDTLLR